MPRTAQAYERVLQVLLIVLALAAVLASAAGCSGGRGKCEDDYDCEETFVCNRSTGKCEPIRCTTDQDCVDPTLTCVDNRCVERSFGEDVAPKG